MNANDPRRLPNGPDEPEDAELVEEEWADDEGPPRRPDNPDPGPDHQNDTRPMAEDHESREAGEPPLLSDNPDKGQPLQAPAAGKLQRAPDGAAGLADVPGGLPGPIESSSTSYPPVTPPDLGKTWRSGSPPRQHAGLGGLPLPAPAFGQPPGGPIGMPALPPVPGRAFGPMASLPPVPASPHGPPGRGLTPSDLPPAPRPEAFRTVAPPPPAQAVPPPHAEYGGPHGLDLPDLPQPAPAERRSPPPEAPPRRY